MGVVSNFFLDPSIWGHGLVKPALWLGRKISRICTDPLPAEGQPREFLTRTVKFVALVIAMAVASILALVGMAIKLGAVVIKNYAPSNPPHPLDRDLENWCNEAPQGSEAY